MFDQTSAGDKTSAVILGSWNLEQATSGTSIMTGFVQPLLALYPLCKIKSSKI